MAIKTIVCGNCKHFCKVELDDGTMAFFCILLPKLSSDDITLLKKCDCHEKKAKKAKKAKKDH